jgi:hypothetical protein
MSRVLAGAGVFCPACQVYVSFTDDRADVKDANRHIEEALRDLSKTIEIRLEL